MVLVHFSPTLRCGLCGALDHAMRGCPNSGVVCRACLSTGHAEPNCPDTSRDESLNQVSERFSVVSALRIDWIVQLFDHLFWEVASGSASKQVAQTDDWY